MRWIVDERVRPERAWQTTPSTAKQSQNRARSLWTAAVAGKEKLDVSTGLSAGTGPDWRGTMTSEKFLTLADVADVMSSPSGDRDCDVMVGDSHMSSTRGLEVG
jgi:hypothetical protein